METSTLVVGPASKVVQPRTWRISSSTSIGGGGGGGASGSGSPSVGGTATGGGQSIMPWSGGGGGGGGVKESGGWAPLCHSSRVARRRHLAPASLCRRALTPSPAAWPATIPRSSR